MAKADKVAFQNILIKIDNDGAEGLGRWNAPSNQPNIQTVVFYRFTDTDPSTEAPNPTYQSFNPEYRTLMRSIIDDAAAIAGITFVEVNSTDTTSAAAIGAYVISGSLQIDAATTAGLSTTPLPSTNAGDLTMDTTYGVTEGITKGTLTHELGHGLGLKHPFDPDGPVPALTDSSTVADNTIMSYIEPEVNTFTFRPWDVQALSYLYGTPADAKVTYNFANNKMTATGTAGDDRFTGSTIADTINAGDGDDLVYASFGNDIVNGGKGNDSLYGGEGDDLIHGDDGNDILNGGNGNDQLFGDAGNDIFYISEGADIYNGGAGIDSIDGQKSLDALEVDLSDAASYISIETLLGSNVATGDTLSGSNLADDISGLAGTDNISGGANADTINGGADNDIINGEAGADVIYGGTGDDLLIGGFGNDMLYGDSGTDTAQFEEVEANYTLTKGAFNETIVTNNVSNEADVLSNVDKIAYQDKTVNIDSSYHSIATNNNDDVSVSLGDVTLNGGAGHDKLVALSGSNSALGGEGNDLLIGGYQIDTLKGDAGNDILVGDASQNMGGADNLEGGTGNDVLMGGKGIDTFVFKTNEGSDVIGSFSLADITYVEATGYNVAVTGSDFISGQDKVYLSAFNGLNAGNVMDSITANADGLLFSASGTDITFYGLTDGQLLASDFIFA